LKSSTSSSNCHPVLLGYEDSGEMMVDEIDPPKPLVLMGFEKMNGTTMTNDHNMDGQNNTNLATLLHVNISNAGPSNSSSISTATQIPSMSTGKGEQQNYCSSSGAGSSSGKQQPRQRKFYLLKIKKFCHNLFLLNLFLLKKKENCIVI
jgi:hypothetical protein